MVLRKSMDSFELISDDENGVIEEKVHKELKEEHKQTMVKLRELQNLFERCVAYTRDERTAMRLVYAV